MREIHRFVAPVRRLRLHGARQQIRRIGFDHQPVRRNMLHQFAQMQAAAFVAEPAGDADVPVPVQTVEQFLAGAGETMDHRRAQATVEILHHRDEVIVRVTLVQEQRLAILGGQLQLALECPALCGPRREIAVVVQPAFAHRHHLGVCMQFAHLGVALVGVLQRLMRMHTGGGEQFARIRPRQDQCFRRVLAARAGDHHPRHAGGARALQHRLAVVVEAAVGEIGADIDQGHTQATKNGVRHCTEAATPLRTRPATNPDTTRYNSAGSGPPPASTSPRASAFTSVPTTTEDPPCCAP